jgi:hypothetical protein
LAKSPTVIDGIRPRKSGSHQTPRWRKPDSNHRSRVTRPIFECRLGLIPRRPKKSARKRTGTRRVGRIPAGPMVRILLSPAASLLRTCRVYRQRQQTLSPEGGLSCFDRSLDRFWRSFRAVVISYHPLPGVLSMRVTVAEWERSGRRQPEAGPAAIPSAANAVPQSFAVDAGNWNRSVVPLDTSISRIGSPLTLDRPVRQPMTGRWHPGMTVPGRGFGRGPASIGAQCRSCGAICRDLVARIGVRQRGLDGVSGTPFLTLGSHRAIQSQPRPPSSYPEAAAQSDELGCL